MRTTVLGLMAVVGLAALVFGFCSQRTPAHAQFPASDPSHQGIKDGQIIAFSVEAGEGRQQVTLVDASARTMSVYHIEAATGEIQLKSVRRFHWDLQMEEFNGTAPSPRDIRTLLEQR